MLHKVSAMACSYSTICLSHLSHCYISCSPYIHASTQLSDSVSSLDLEIYFTSYLKVTLEHEFWLEEMSPSQGQKLVLGMKIILLLCINYSTYQIYNISVILKALVWLKVQNFPLESDNGKKIFLKNTELLRRPLMHIIFYVLSDWQAQGLVGHLECVCSHVFTAMWLQKITNILQSLAWL